MFSECIRVEKRRKKKITKKYSTFIYVSISHVNTTIYRSFVNYLDARSKMFTPFERPINIFSNDVIEFRRSVGKVFRNAGYAARFIEFSHLMHALRDKNFRRPRVPLHEIETKARRRRVKIYRDTS